MARQNLLLVDGDAVSARILEVGLRRAGFNVTRAGHGLDALAKVRTSAPDLIVSQARLPELDGFELCKRLREADHGQIPFVVLASDNSHEERARTAALGIPDYIPQPVSIRTLVTQLRLRLEALERERLAAQAGIGRVRGSLADLALIDVVQALEQGRSSGIIRLRSGKRSGTLYIRAGRILDAEADRLRGEEAFYRLLTWEDGEYEFERCQPDNEEAIELGPQTLLAEGLRRLDERARLLEQLPPIDAVYEIDARALADRLSDIPDDVNNVLRLFDGRRTILEVADECGFPESEALTILAKLFFEDLLAQCVLTERTPGTPPAVRIAGDGSQGPASSQGSPQKEPAESVARASATPSVEPLEAARPVEEAQSLSQDRLRFASVPDLVDAEPPSMGPSGAVESTSAMEVAVAAAPAQPVVGQAAADVDDRPTTAPANEPPRIASPIPSGDDGLKGNIAASEEGNPGSEVTHLAQASTTEAAVRPGGEPFAPEAQEPTVGASPSSLAPAQISREETSARSEDLARHGSVDAPMADSTVAEEAHAKSPHEPTPAAPPPFVAEPTPAAPPPFVAEPTPVAPQAFVAEPTPAAPSIPSAAQASAGAQDRDDSAAEELARDDGHVVAPMQIAPGEPVPWEEPAVRLGNRREIRTTPRASLVALGRIPLIRVPAPGAVKGTGKGASGPIVQETIAAGAVRDHDATPPPAKPVDLGLEAAAPPAAPDDDEPLEIEVQEMAEPLPERLPPPPHVISSSAFPTLVAGEAIAPPRRAPYIAKAAPSVLVADDLLREARRTGSATLRLHRRHRTGSVGLLGLGVALLLLLGAVAWTQIGSLDESPPPEARPAPAPPTAPFVARAGETNAPQRPTVLERLEPPPVVETHEAPPPPVAAKPEAAPPGDAESKQVDPADAYAQLLRQAKRLHARGYGDAAAAAAEKALLVNPKGDAALVVLGNCQLDRGNATEAIRYAERALALNARNADAYLIEGTALQQEGRTADARTYYEKYLEIAPHGKHANDLRAILAVPAQ